MIKFKRYSVEDTDLKIKAKVLYHVYKRENGVGCVELCELDFGNLKKILRGEYENNTDMRIDFFEKGRVLLLDTHPLYAAALACAKKYHTYKPE